MSGSLGNIVIGGGSGFIGTHLTTLLKNTGYCVTIVSRNSAPGRLSWNEIQNYGLPDHTKAVVNLAGQNVLDVKYRWNENFKKDVWNSRVNTTCTLAKAIIDSGSKPNAFVVLTGVGIYEPSATKEYQEETQINEYDFLSKMCHEWEKSAKLPSSVRCRQVIIRSGVVLGYDGGMIKQLYTPFFMGLGGPVLPGNQYLPWIHVNDIARLILFCIQHQNVRGIINGVAPHQVTNKEFSKAFARALKRPSLLPVPSAILNILFGEERANMLTKGQKVIPKKAQELGFTYLYPDIHEACAQVVAQPKSLP